LNTHLLELTLPTPALNLALDEALLEVAEQGQITTPILRLWESEQPFVVVGRATKLTEEVNLSVCQQDQVPVLRRNSGGASIVTGPGCLMYGVILSYEQFPQLASLDQCHQFVMTRVLKAVPASEAVNFQGTCDLTYQGRKFSGNSLRCKRNHVLYHGTLMYDFELSMISKYLGQPARMPDYRQSKSHDEFVTNLPVLKQILRSGMLEAWDVDGVFTDWPQELTTQLAKEKYESRSWIHAR